MVMLTDHLDMAISAVWDINSNQSKQTHIVSILATILWLHVFLKRVDKLNLIIHIAMV